MLSVLVKMSVSDVGKQLVAERMNKHPSEPAWPPLSPGVIPGIVARVKMRRRDNTIIVTALTKCRFKIQSREWAEIYISTSRT